jgi:hypothetical protein
MSGVALTMTTLLWCAGGQSHDITPISCFVFALWISVIRHPGSGLRGRIENFYLKGRRGLIA